RTRTPFPEPSTASGDARRPARHGRGSRLSPSREAAGARPPTPAATRSGECSLEDSYSFVPGLSSRLLPNYFSLFSELDRRFALDNFLNLPKDTATISPPDPVLPTHHCRAFQDSARPVSHTILALQ